jgi:hypothetical protein
MGRPCWVCSLGQKCGITSSGCVCVEGAIDMLHEAICHAREQVGCLTALVAVWCTVVWFQGHGRSLRVLPDMISLQDICRVDCLGCLAVMVCYHALWWLVRDRRYLGCLRHDQLAQELTAAACCGMLCGGKVWGEGSAVSIMPGIPRGVLLPYGVLCHALWWLVHQAQSD